MLENRVERHGEQTAGHRDADQIDDDAPAAGSRQERAGVREIRGHQHARAGPMQIDREDRHRSSRRWNEAATHLSVQELLGKDRPGADADGKERQHHRHDLLVGEEHVLRKDRQARHDDEGEEPEPGGRENRQQELRPVRHMRDDIDRVVKQTDARRFARVRRRRGRDLPCGQPADDRADNANGADDQRAVVMQRDAATNDGSGEDREERARFDQRVSGDELMLAQVLRQQGVLDRTEHRRVRPEAKQCREQYRDATLP